MRLPSPATLARLTSGDMGKARGLRRALETMGCLSALHRANDILRQHGVEAIASPHGCTQAAAYYVNNGETYELTLLYDCERGAYYVTSWGDWVETYERTGRGKFE